MSDCFACQLGVVVLEHCILDTSQNHASKGFGNSHTKFGVFVSNMGCRLFLVTLMLFHVKHAIETYNISFEDTQNKQQYGTTITAQR